MRLFDSRLSASTSYAQISRCGNRRLVESSYTRLQLPGSRRERLRQEAWL